MDINIFSDTICPWCFIGKRRLERARYLETKFGAAVNANAIYEQVRAAGDSENIPFAFDKMTRTPNTV